MESFKDKLESLFNQYGVLKTFSRGDYLTREGETETSLYYIESGAVRAFYLSEHEESVIRLGYKGSIITSLSSFLTGRPSDLYIEAIRKTSTRILSKSALRELVNQDIDTLRQYTTLLEQTLIQQMDREIDLITPSPAERLERVLNRSAHLFQEIPLKYIASYLRMTPETLSRIRNS